MKIKQVLMIAAVLLAMLVMPVVANDDLTPSMGTTVITYSGAEYTPFVLSVPPTVSIDGETSLMVMVTSMSNYPKATVNVKIGAENDQFILTHKIESSSVARYDVKKGTLDVTSGEMILNALKANDGVTLTLSLEEGQELYAGEYAGTLTFTATEVRPTVLEGEQTLSNVISNAGTNPVAIYLPATEESQYVLPSIQGKDVTIIGNGVTEMTVGANSGATVNCANSDVTFKDMTINFGSFTSGNDRGITHAGNVVYDSCTILGATHLYGDSVTFKNCNFDLSSVSDYIWTYGAKEVVFDGCSFNTKGKAILIYEHGPGDDMTVTIKNCEFTASESGSAYGIPGSCAAVEIDSSKVNPGIYTVNFEGTNTIDTEFSGLFRVKSAPEGMTDQDNTNVAVFIDDEEQDFTVGVAVSPSDA